VLAFIAQDRHPNGRDLEGALNRLLANSKLNGQPITLEMAEREVRDLIRPQEPRRVQDRGDPAHRGAPIQRQPRRSAVVATHRQRGAPASGRDVSCQDPDAAARCPRSGGSLGGRDHTTVLHAVRKIEHLVGADNALAEEIEVLKRQLQE